MKYSTVNFKIKLATGAVQSFPISTTDGIPEDLEKKLAELGLTKDHVYMKDRDGDLVSLEKSDGGNFDGIDEVELFTNNSKRGFFAKRRQKAKKFLNQLTNGNDEAKMDPSQESGSEGSSNQNQVGYFYGGAGTLPPAANRFPRPGCGLGGLGAFGGGCGGFGGCRRFGRPGFGL